MSLKDILQGKKKKRKKDEKSLRVNVVEIIGNFSIVRDEEDFAILKNDGRVMKHLEEQKGLLLPKARLDKDGCLTLTTLQPCKVPKMPLVETDDDKGPIEALRKKIIEQLNKDDVADDDLTFEEISRKGIKKIDSISLFVTHVGKEIENPYGNFRCLVVFDKKGVKTNIFLNHLRLLDHLKEAPGTFTFGNVDVAQTSDFKLKTTAKTSIKENKDLDFENVKIGDNFVEASLYHFEEPTVFENNDWKVFLLFQKDDLGDEEDDDTDEKIENIAKKLKTEDDDGNGDGNENGDDDESLGSDDDGEEEKDKDKDDNIIRIAASWKGLKSVQEIKDLKDIDSEKLTDILLNYIGRKGAVDYNVASNGVNFAQRIRFL